MMSRDWRQLGSLLLALLFLPVATLRAQSGTGWTAEFNGPSTYANVGVATSGERAYVYGELGALWSTTDGASWQRLQVPQPLNLSAMVAAPQARLVERYDHEWYRTTDDITWNVVDGPRASNDQPYETRIRFGNGVFVRSIAVGASTSSGLEYPSPGRLAYSADGATWIAASFGGVVAGALDFGAGRFLLRTSAGVWSSVDGAIWTQVSELDLRRSVLAGGDDRFVAIDMSDPSNLRSLVSLDGATWTEASFPGAAWGAAALSYFDGWYYAQAPIAENGAARSTDGVTWETAAAPSEFDPARAVKWGDFQLAFAHPGYGSEWVKRTPGSDWETVRAQVSPPALDSVAFGNGLFVAPGYRSPDGSHWSADGFMPPATEREVRVEYCHGRFFYFEGESLNTAGTQTSARIFSSVDGVSGQLVVNTELAGSFGGGDVTYDGSRYVLVGPAGVLVSTDGDTWLRVKTWEPINEWNPDTRLASGLGQLVLTSNHTLLTSTDGVTWTERYRAVNDPYRAAFPELGDVVFDGERFVVTASRSNKTLAGFTAWTLVSTDAVNWISTESAASPRPGFFGGNLVQVDGLYAFIGQQEASPVLSRSLVNYLFVSADGFTWERKDLLPAPGLWTLTVGADGRLYAVGDGTVYSMPMPSYSGPVTPAPSLPAISVQPASTVSLDRTGSVTLRVDVAGNGPIAYQWRRDGVPLDGATSDALLVTGTANGGRPACYDVVVSSLAGSVTSEPSQVEIADSWFLNLSSRAWSGAGEDAVYQGFVLAGNGQSLVTRSVGPTLADFGVNDVLADPALQVVRLADSAVVQENDNWASTSSNLLADTFARLGAFALREASKDAAVFSYVPGAGSYSIITKSVDGSTGIVLSELYSDDSAGGRLVNLSTRARVGVGERVLTAGFVITGGRPMSVLIRGVGLRLADFGVNDPLADPYLILRDASGAEMGRNDNWGESPQAAEMVSQSEAVGAFPLVEGSADAVILVELAPGVYTVQLQSGGPDDGVALLELYEVR